MSVYCARLSVDWHRYPTIQHSSADDGDSIIYLLFQIFELNQRDIMIFSTLKIFLHFQVSSFCFTIHERGYILVPIHFLCLIIHHQKFSYMSI